MRIKPKYRHRKYGPVRLNTARLGVLWWITSLTVDLGWFGRGVVYERRRR